MSFYYAGTTYYIQASRDDADTADALALAATLFPNGLHVDSASAPFKGHVAPHLQPFTQVDTYAALKEAWHAPEMTALPRETPATHAVPHVTFREQDGQPLITLHVPVSCEDANERDMFLRRLDAFIFATLGSPLLGGKRKVGTALDTFETLPFEMVLA